MTRPIFSAAMLLCLCTAAHAQSTLQVLDFGAEPRATIRYQFQPGLVERATMDMSMNFSMEMNGQKMPATVTPSIKATMEVRVAEVAADGSARLEFKTQSAEAPVKQVAGQANEALLNRTLAGLTMLSGWYRSDTRGSMLESHVSLPESFLPADAMQSMNQLMGQGSENLQQFPQEVVGVGARWRVVHQREIGGRAITLAQEFTLKSRNGNSLELLVNSVEPVIAQGSSPAPAVADNVQQRSSGTIRIDLRKLVPAMSIDSSSNSTTTLPVQGEPRVMKISSQMRMSVVPLAQ